MDSNRQHRWFRVHGVDPGCCLSLIPSCHHQATRSRTMKTSPTPPQDAAEYELRFQSLFDEGRAYAFPCDARGQVNMDALSDRARQNYLYARAVIGFEVAMPAVRGVGALH